MVATLSPSALNRLQASVTWIAMMLSPRPPLSALSVNPRFRADKPLQSEESPNSRGNANQKISKLGNGNGRAFLISLPDGADSFLAFI